jgi:hypothetical protein
MPILDRGKNAHRANPRVALEGFSDCRTKRLLSLGHGLALRFRRSQVFSARDGFRLRNLPGLVVDYDLGKRITLCCVDRELGLAFIDLKFR